METNRQNDSKLVEGGMEDFERTEQYRLRVGKIKRELTEKYVLILSGEKNWFKRLLIKIRLKIEIDRRISQLSSGKNLHSAIVDLT